MEERDIVNVRSDENCMSANENMSSACTRTIDTVLSLEYEDEPDKTFKEYNRKWDKAQIFGDEAI